MKIIFDTSSKKFNCPKCNKKRFVRYIEIETNNYLDEAYGKCDRETSCGYFRKPESIITSLIDYSIAKPITKPNIIVELPSFHTIDLLQKSLNQYHNNNFYLYLLTIFNKDEIQNVFDKYKIGTSKAWNGATVFWQIDNEHKIRAGKIILLDLNTCKRVKIPYNHITWVHSKLKLESFNLKQCLFGLHLINSSNKIAIVESEKTAIIMALFMPEYTWVATGSKQNFKNDILYPLIGKEVMAFPDKSEFNDWHKKALSINKLGYNISVSEYVEKIDCESGTDLADIYIALENKVEVKKLTNQEIEIIRLSDVNPELLNLIETFELCDWFDNVLDVGRLDPLLPF